MTLDGTSLKNAVNFDCLCVQLSVVGVSVSICSLARALFVYMYVCVIVRFVCEYMFFYVCVSMCICLCIGMHACMYICAYASRCVFVSVYICVYLCCRVRVCCVCGLRRFNLHIQYFIQVLFKFILKIFQSRSFVGHPFKVYTHK